MPARIPDKTRNRFAELLSQGLSIKEASQRTGVSYSWGKSFAKGLRNASSDAYREAREQREWPAPIAYEDLSEEARRGWDDFEFFCRRYVGLILTPWQVETAERLVAWMGSDERVYAVENCPPGVGKTTLAYALAAWATVRNRRIRGLFGSRAENNARRQLRRLRRLLERTHPVRARPEWIERGIAIDAEATVSEDYGAFRPEASEVWRSEEFVVQQQDDRMIEEKEPTWSCYGQDSGVLGNRFNLILWDDVVDKKSLRTSEAIDRQRRWWDEEAETRLEPGGTMLLIGQRMASNDLYRYCLDKKVFVAEDDEEGLDALGESGQDDRPSLYKHVSYRAHYEERCEGRESHRRSSAEPWPDGCLLDPFRLPWTDLRNIRETKPHQWRVSYQQEDADPDDVLIPPTWIWGGVDPKDGTDLPGCVDDERDICSPLPSGMVGPWASIATVDPSGTKKWATQWWVTANAAGDVPMHFLMDLESKSMQANELLDWNASEGTFYGLMDEWQARSVEMGHPITHWIVEDNAAQRYLLVYDHVRRWRAKWGVNIVPHTTGPQHYKRIDNERGPAILRDPIRHGRVRLPGKQGPTSRARVKTLKLVTELTRWPHSSTDDQVMAMWFHQLHLPRIVRPRQEETPRMWRPTWMREEAKGWAADAVMAGRR